MPLGVLYKAYIISHQNKISPSLINHLQAINSITCSGLNLCFAAPKLTIIHKSWWLLVMNKIIIEREHIPKPHPHETTWRLLYKEHWDVILPWCLNLWTSMKYWYELADNHLKFQSMYIQRNQPPKVHPPLRKKNKNNSTKLWVSIVAAAEDQLAQHSHTRKLQRYHQQQQINWSFPKSEQYYGSIFWPSVSCSLGYVHIALH